MSDISFLPEEMKTREEALKETTLPEAGVKDLKMHVPEEENEDIEIIEVDETEVEQMLSGEPLYTKFYYKLSLWADEFKLKYLQPRKLEAPPKTPPFPGKKSEFFKPPEAKPAVSGSGAMTKASPEASIPAATKSPEAAAPIVPVAAPTGTTRPATMGKIRITAGAGKRVRIIKRIRKPVQVSLLNEELMQELRVDIPKRKFTLAFLAVLFAVVFGGSYLLLARYQAQADTDYNKLNTELTDLKSRIGGEEQKWQDFRDLEPRLLAISDLLQNHARNTKLLAFFENNTLQDVYYLNMTVGADGAVGLSVKATSMEAAARQLLVFQQAPEIASVVSTAFSQVFDDKGMNAVNYQLQIKFKPGVFNQTP